MTDKTTILTEKLKGFCAPFQPQQTDIPCLPMYHYYSVNAAKYGSEATAVDWSIRHLIWDFKDGLDPNDGEKAPLYDKAFTEVTTSINNLVSKIFGQDKSCLTLACVPASTKFSYHNRYCNFYTAVCAMTGMQSGYPFIHIAKEGIPKHSKDYTPGSEAEFAVTPNAFTNKDVLIFDDIITKGETLRKFTKLLQADGANVIGAITLGDTVLSPNRSMEDQPWEILKLGL